MLLGLLLGGAAGITPALLSGLSRLGEDLIRAPSRPHLEEAYWFGEGVMPELAARGLLERASAAGVPAANGRPASAPGGAPLLLSGGR